MGWMRHKYKVGDSYAAEIAEMSLGVVMFSFWKMSTWPYRTSYWD